MRSHRDGSTPVFNNAFDPGFLTLVDRLEEPPTAAEAEKNVLWRVVPTRDGRWAVLADGDDLGEGDAPAAVLHDHGTALLVAAALPGTGRDPLVRLRKDPEADGFPLEVDGEIVGHLRLFDVDLGAALQTLESLRRAPLDLARLLQGTGGVALQRAGKILRRLVLEAGAEEVART